MPVIGTPNNPNINTSMGAGYGLPPKEGTRSFEYIFDFTNLTATTLALSKSLRDLNMSVIQSVIIDNTQNPVPGVFTINGQSQGVNSYGFSWLPILVTGFETAMTMKVFPAGLNKAGKVKIALVNAQAAATAYVSGNPANATHKSWIDRSVSLSANIVAQIMPANPARLGLFLQTTKASTVEIFAAFGKNATSTGGAGDMSFVILPGGGIYNENWGQPTNTDFVTAISTASQALIAYEITF